MLSLSRRAQTAAGQSARGARAVITLARLRHDDGGVVGRTAPVVQERFGAGASIRDSLPYGAKIEAIPDAVGVDQQEPLRVEGEHDGSDAWQDGADDAAIAHQVLRPSVLPQLRFDVPHAGKGQLPGANVDASNEQGRPAGACEGLVAALDSSGGVASGVG